MAVISRTKNELPGSFFSVFSPPLNRHNGEGGHLPSREESGGLGCPDLRQSKKQAQRPRRRLFQVRSSPFPNDPGSVIPRTLHMGAAFPLKCLWKQDYRQHSKHKVWECLCHLVTHIHARAHTLLMSE